MSLKFTRKISCIKHGVGKRDSYHMFQEVVRKSICLKKLVNVSLLVRMHSVKQIESIACHVSGDQATGTVRHNGHTLDGTSSFRRSPSDQADAAAVGVHEERRHVLAPDALAVLTRRAAPLFAMHNEFSLDLVCNNLLSR